MPAAHDRLLAGLSALVRANDELGAVMSGAHGLHEAAIRTLVMVGSRGGAPTTPMMVSRELGLSSGTVTPILDRLAQLDLMVRVPNPADRRGSLLRLTAAGAAVADRMKRGYADSVAEALGTLTPEDAERFLSRLADGLAAAARAYSDADAASSEPPA